jgi:hypothetical protein
MKGNSVELIRKALCSVATMQGYAISSCKNALQRSNEGARNGRSSRS